jgi:hypothetical protein
LMVLPGLRQLPSGQLLSFRLLHPIRPHLYDLITLVLQHGLGSELAVKTVDMVCTFPMISVTRTSLFLPMPHQWLLATRSGKIFICPWVYVKEAVFLLHSLYP